MGLKWYTWSFNSGAGGLGNDGTFDLSSHGNPQIRILNDRGPREEADQVLPLMQALVDAGKELTFCLKNLGYAVNPNLEQGNNPHGWLSGLFPQMVKYDGNGKPSDARGAEVDLPALIIEGGRVGPWMAWVAMFLTRVRELGFVPSKIFLDFERYPIRNRVLGRDFQSQWESVRASQEALDELPDYLRDVTFQDFLDSIPNQGAYQLYDRWSYEIGADALRRAVAVPAHEIFPDCHVIQYGDYRPTETWTVRDWNQKTYLAHDVDNWSAPSCYIQEGNYGLDKHPTWNSLILGLNLIGTCLGRSYRVCPAIPEPTWRGNGIPFATDNGWAWKTQVRHFARRGVNDLWQWRHGWNRSDPDRQATHEMMEELKDETFPRSNILEMIPWDADAVVSGDLETTYQEWLEGIGAA